MNEYLRVFVHAGFFSFALTRPQCTGKNPMDQSDARMAHRNDQSARAFELPRTSHEIINGSSWGEKEPLLEVDLLLPNWQMMELEKAASHLGLTMGQLLRRLIWIYLAKSD